METIPKNDCQQIGYLQRPHGLQGEIQLQFQPQYGDSLEEVEVLFLERDGLLVPFFIEEDGLRFRSNESALVHFLWTDTEEEARKLSGSAVYMHNDDYERVDEDFGVHELQGYKLIDKNKGLIGEILAVDDYAGNLLLTVMYNNEELMVPFSNDFLIEVNHDNKELLLNCPSGIFDL